MSNNISSSIKRIDLNITPLDNAHIFSGAKEILKHTGKVWKEDEIRFKVFTEGYTNRLIGIYREDDQDDIVLVRINGENTELFIDREKEIKTMHLMHKYKLGSPVYCAFNNGICYGFLPGTTIHYEDAVNEKIAQKIAFRIAEMHTIDIEENNDHSIQPMLFPLMRKCLNLIPDEFTKTDLNKRFKEHLGSKEKLNKEIEYLERELLNLNTDVVFSHNDLLFRNIIYDIHKEDIGFVDFEYGGYNYQPFDIANHFCEFAGVENYDGKLIPDEKFRRAWIVQYLDRWAQLNDVDPYTEEEIDTFAEHVDKFMMSSHLLWGLWAIVQAENSHLDEVDFLGFGILRINEYQLKKDELN